MQDLVHFLVVVYSMQVSYLLYASLITCLITLSLPLQMAMHGTNIAKHPRIYSISTSSKLLFMTHVSLLTYCSSKLTFSDSSVCIYCICA
jgi:hypothetical protein